MKKLNSLKKLTCKKRLFTPFQNVDFNQMVEFAVRRLIRDVNKFYTTNFKSQTSKLMKSVKNFYTSLSKITLGFKTS